MEAAPQDPTQAERQRGFEWDDIGSIRAHVPIADRALIDPVSEWLEVRSAVVMVERQVEGDMEERRAGQGPEPRAAQPEAEPEERGVERRGVVDGEDAPPERREIASLEDRLKIPPQRQTFIGDQQIKREIRQHAADQRGGCHRTAPRPPESGRRDQKMGRRVHRE